MDDPIIGDVGGQTGGMTGGPDDLPPEPPKARSVLSDILARAAADTEAETRRLQEEIREREERERAAREEEERRKREELRARVEAERQQRLQQIEEYERRKREEEAARAAAAAPASTTEASSATPARPKRSRTPLFAGAAVLVLAVAGGGIWLALPKGEPVVFALERTPVVARAGEMSATPLPFGPATVEAARSPVPAERVVAVTTPGKYEAAPPRPRVVRNGGGRPAEERGPQLKIQTGIFGKGKIIK